MSSDTPELVFQQAVEGLFFRGLAGKVTSELVLRLRRAGLDLEKPLAPAYPRQTWNKVLQITAETLWPDEPPERAYHLLGKQLLSGYSETMVGKTLAAILRLIGPRRTLARMERNFRSGGNFNQCQLSDLQPNQVLFWLNEPEIHPAYVGGILEASLTLAGAQGLQIEVHQRDDRGCAYRIRWSS